MFIFVAFLGFALGVLLAAWLLKREASAREKCLCQQRDDALRAYDLSRLSNTRLLARMGEMSAAE